MSSIVCRKEGRKSEMGLLKEKKPNRILRGVKTFFFLVRMTVSLLLCSAPVILVVADALIHCAMLSAFISPPLSLDTLSSLLRNYEFRNSIVDIPIISIARSLVIICVYCMCDGPGLSHGPYVGVTTLCSLLSLVFVSMKACSFGPKMRLVQHRYFDEWWAMEAMFLCTSIMAVGHVVFAYKTSCRERRKLLVYRIDLEAVLQIPPLPKRMGFPSIKSFCNR